jgi:hypothetical protein
MGRALGPGSRPGATGAPVADNELADHARREFAPFDPDAARGLPHHVGGKSHTLSAAGDALLQDHFHGAARRPLAVRAYERSAGAYVLQQARDRRRGSASQLHGLMHCDALTPSMLHDRTSRTKW